MAVRYPGTAGLVESLQTGVPGGLAGVTKLMKKQSEGWTGLRP